MSSAPPDVAACDACLRRTRLLALLAPHVERGRHRRHLGQLLALDDDALLAAVAGRGRGGVEGTLAAFDPAAERRREQAAGLWSVCRHDARYPAALRDADDAPVLLHGAGDLRALSAVPSAVAVVGARRATATGLEVARTLGRGLAAAGVPVVSGLALGTDSAAHAGALEVGGPTIAVLAGGADVPYPRSKAHLHRRIAATPGCCVVSEMPAGFAPFKWGFPARNRIIAGLGRCTVVVEAAERSGSLITAEMAQDLGRVVAAVPGAVTNPLAAGANALLRDGAELVRDATDVLDGVFGVGVRTAPPRPPGPRLPEPLQDLLERLGSAPAGAATLAAEAADADAVVAGLAELELLGLARRTPGGIYVRVPA